MTDVDWMPAGTKVSAERILMRNPAQIWSRVRTGVDPGGFTGAVKAILLVEYVIFGGARRMVWRQLSRSEFGFKRKIVLMDYEEFLKLGTTEWMS